MILFLIAMAANISWACTLDKHSLCNGTNDGKGPCGCGCHRI
jgi:hypothetical protein